MQNKESVIYLFIKIIVRKLERKVWKMSALAAIGVIGGIAILAVIIVVAVVAVVVSGAFNSIKDDEV